MTELEKDCFDLFEETYLELNRVVTAYIERQAELWFKQGIPEDIIRERFEGLIDRCEKEIIDPFTERLEALG